MKKGLIVTVSMLALATFVSVGCAEEKKGGAIFKEKCAMCHPDGGNIMKADKTLKKADLAKNKIKSDADLVKYLRNPGPGMTKFDAKALPDKDAKEVAEYVLKTFK
jgi:cytochrome c6